MTTTLRTLETTTRNGRHVTVDTPFTDAQAARALLGVPANDFVASLIRQLRAAKFDRETGMITSQVSPSILCWTHKLAVEHSPETQTLREERQQDNAVNVGHNLADMFGVALINKLKFPKMTFVINGETLQFSLAGPRSKYSGAIMVTDGKPFGQNTWFGFIRNGQFFPSSRCDSAVSDLVATIAQDPQGFADEYGKLTGNCCFCRHKLTSDESTVAGYGPVCAKKFGLKWGNKN